MGGIKVTPWKTALPPFSKFSRPSLDLTNPFPPAGAEIRNEKSSAELATIGGDGRHLEPAIGIFGRVKRNPRGHLGIG